MFVCVFVCLSESDYVPSQMDEDEESKTIFEFAYAFSQPSESM